MSDLISTPPAPASPVGSTVAADGWFPDIDVADVREKALMGESIVTHARLVAAIEGAIVTALRQLVDWRAVHAAAGIASLADVPDTILIDGDPVPVTIGGQPRALVLWQRIVRNYAAAEVADLHRRLVATDQQIQRSDEQRSAADDYRRLAHNAVADLMSIGAAAPVPRNHAELI